MSVGRAGSLIRELERFRDGSATPASRRIASIYGDAQATAQCGRYRALLARWLELFPDERAVQVYRAPGRVNLLGEHTDYNGLPVLPMAIQRDLLLVCASRTDSQVCIRNVSEEFPAREFKLEFPLSPYEAGDWGNYCKASYQALSGLPAARETALAGMSAVVSGDIPPGAGLSSSTALVVLTATAALGLHGVDIGKKSLAGVLATGEHYVGTRGGGMDQTVSLLAEREHALLVNFVPLEARPISLPGAFAFVAAHSLVEARKSGKARLAYNTRPAECRLAVAVVNHALAHIAPAAAPLELLGGLCSPEGRKLTRDPQQFLDTVFPHEHYTVEMLAGVLAIPPAEIRSRFLGDGDAGIPEPEGGFPLKKRCRHQLTEWSRVERAPGILMQGDAEGFGLLMNESHSSCAQDYEISCPELDELVRVARDAGALGSRLTGAGFGGCTVSMVIREGLAGFLLHLEEDYYCGRPATGEAGSKGYSGAPVEKLIVCEPSAGACRVF